MTIASNTIESLESLRLPELRALYAEVTGQTTKTPNKTYLIRTIREALAAQAAEVIEEEQAIEEMTATAEPEPAQETTTEPEPASAPTVAEEPANVEPAPIAEELEPATTEPTVAPESAEEPATEPEPTEDEIEALAIEADLVEMTEMAAEMAAEDAAADSATERKLSKLSVAELQAKYLEVVGRPTGSSHKRYLVWKIREAQKGKVPVGPRTQRVTAASDADMKILPLRMESTLVEQLDAARQRMGLKSRMDLFRKALSHYMANAGETELAAALAAE